MAPDMVPPRAPQSFFRRHEQWILGGGAVFAFLVFWQGLNEGWWSNLLAPVLGSAASGFHIKPIFISSPTAVAAEAWQMFFVTGEIWPDLASSAQEYICGFLLGVVVAIPLGMAAGWYRRLHDVVEPAVSALNASPLVAFLPLLVIWFGLGLGSKVALIFLLVLPVMTRSAMSGVRTTDPRLLRVAKSFCCSDMRLFVTVILPSTVPFLLAGLRVSVGLAMVGIVVGEVYGSQYGVGVMINIAGARFQTNKVFVGVLVIAVTGLLLTHLIRFIETKVDGWRPKRAGGR